MSPADEARERRLLTVYGRRHPIAATVLVFLGCYGGLDFIVSTLDWAWPTTGSNPSPQFPVPFLVALVVHVRCRRLRVGAPVPNDGRGRKALAAFARRHPWRAAVTLMLALYSLCNLSFDLVDRYNRRFGRVSDTTAGRVVSFMAFSVPALVQIHHLRRTGRAAEVTTAAGG